MTGKQRVLEILQQLASDQCDKVNIDKLAITEALDSIEEMYKNELVRANQDGYNQGYAKGKTDGEKIGNTKGRQDMQWHIDNRTGNYD